MTGDLALRLNAGFADIHGGAPAMVVRAPGRVNLIGEHTDYNDECWRRTYTKLR